MGIKLEVGALTNTQLFNMLKLILKPVVVLNDYASHRSDVLTVFSTEVLGKVGSMYFVIFYFGAAGDHLQRAGYVVESSQGSERFTLSVVPKDQILLFNRIQILK